jgi:hypothetical protein
MEENQEFTDKKLSLVFGEGDAQLHRDMEAVHSALSDAKKYNLETEVVCWALMAMKADPEMSIEDAIWYGYNEWVK